MSPTVRAILHRLSSADPQGLDLDALDDLHLKGLKPTLAKLVKQGAIADGDGIYRIDAIGRDLLRAANPAPPAAPPQEPPPAAVALPFVAGSIAMRRVADLVPSARNAKKHPPEQVALLAGAIQQHGFTQPLLIDPADGVIAGHGRLLAAQQLGLVEVPCIVLPHLGDAQRRAYMLADNRLAELAGWDDKILHQELEAIAAQGIDVGTIGYDEAALESIAKRLVVFEAGPGGGADEDAPEPDAARPAHSQRGLVYELGPHRLMCGDSTSPEDRATLFGSDAPDILLTDPPYCSGGFQEAGRAAGSIGSLQVKKGQRFEGGIANDKLSSRGYQAMMKRVLEVWGASSLYIFTDWRMWVQLYDLCESSGYGVRNMIVWDKGTPGMGMGWRTQHELLAYATRVSVKFDGHKAVGNVLQSKRTGNKLHPTQKPVDILETVLDVHERADIVGDPFAGSGSTLMACASRSRAFRGMELMPHFCDVIRRRWTRWAREHQADVGPGGLDD